MNVIGHNDESMKLKAALASVFLEHGEEELGVMFHLEQTATARSHRGNKEGTDLLRANCREEVEAHGPRRKP